MARRIVYAESPHYYADDDRKPPKIDERLDIDWRTPIHIDDWTGDVSSARPSYEVKRLGWASMGAVGRLTVPDEIAWLEKAMLNEPDGGLVARVNETNVSNGEGDTSGFRIEVLTGADAKAFFRNETWEDRSAFLAKHWWKIAIAIVVLYWWLR
ncbi:hypothetical protein ACFSOZ_11705 [Mesorhizobium newzealandense]|uniref:Uncharacterized protein n=1 Tax=Mesorhizobium newzealandense TaxID=1300302 RepID=A0ABW4UB71_9HYPH